MTRSASKVARTPRVFVRFVSHDETRADWTLPVIDEVKRLGCHWACSHREARRPRSISDGDIIFMARIVDHPHNILVYGRALAMKHVTGRDSATGADIELRPWKAEWPCYIRLRHPEFVDGTIADGVPLFAMMDELAEKTFTSTKRNAKNGNGNIDPKRAYWHQPSMELTPDATKWLSARLEHAFVQHGRISRRTLALLDWPEGWGPLSR